MGIGFSNMAFYTSAPQGCLPLLLYGIQRKKASKIIRY